MIFSPDNYSLPIESRIPIADSYADTQFEIVKSYIQQFENSLDSEHIVGLKLTNFGSSTLMQVERISYEMPVLMIFHGTVEGNPSTLIQHISQLNFLLVAVPLLPEKKKYKIGFSLPQSDKE